MKIVIIGGVAGGMSAATRLRRLMEDAEIVVMEKGPFVSFANCGLPYYVSGEIAEREQLLVQTPEALKARFNLDVRPHHEVVAIDPIEKVITVKHETEILTEHYDKLILSPGAKPFVPPITGLAEAKNYDSLDTRNKTSRRDWRRLHWLGNGRKLAKTRIRSHSRGKSASCFTAIRRRNGRFCQS